MRTSYGDTLIVATARLEGGLWVNYAYGLLADNRLLVVGTPDDNPLTPSVFASVDLAGTDGSSIGTSALAGAPELLAPAPDGLILLDEGAAYRVTGSTQLQKVRSWQPGAAIVVHEASLISPFEPFFLTNRTDWISVEADYVGVATQSVIEAVTDIEFGSAVITLGNGTAWRVAYTDEGEALTWQTGDAVAVVQDDSSFLGHRLARLATGETVIVEPD
jgi:hypothetical protein